MVTNLREAKSRFSELVKLAAEGEDILITVRGEPMARLIGVGSREPRGDRKDWIAELTKAAELESPDGPVETPQAYWDETRSER